MFTMLLANSEGRGFLTDSKLLREIALNLEALDPVFPQFWTTLIGVASPKSWRTVLLKTGLGGYHDFRVLCHVGNTIRPQRRTSNDGSTQHVHIFLPHPRSPLKRRPNPSHHHRIRLHSRLSPADNPLQSPHYLRQRNPSLRNLTSRQAS